MKKIAIFGDKKNYKKIFPKFIRDNKKVSFIFLDLALKKSPAILDDVDAVIFFPRKLISKNFLKNAKKLKWIHVGGAGIEHFMNLGLENYDITLTNGKIIQGPEVADHAVALLLAITRNIAHYVENKKKIKSNFINRPIELRKKVCGILGTGGIGFLVAERLKSFGVEIYSFENELIQMSTSIDKYFSYNNLLSEIKHLDILICCAPLTNITHNLIDFKILDKMKNDSILINVSRGKVLKTKDLLRKNLYKKFRGIGLDVTEPEPLPKNHILRNQPNIIITQHSAGLSEFNRQRALDLMLDNLSRYINGKKLLNIVDKVNQY
jgi:D-2-hydroxyacid dehydrogenase (NADP+)